MIGLVAARAQGWRVSIVLAAMFLASPGRAMVFLSTGDPSFNTTAPTGSMTNCGWQWQGNWRGFTGTPIASNLFLTAKHLGGSIGDVFRLGTNQYTTVASYLDTQSDLALWQVCGTFPSFAPLATGESEVGTTCVMFGRGGNRGGAVTRTNGTLVFTMGWLWGSFDGQLRWGRNQIAGMASMGSGNARVLKIAFDKGGVAHEACLVGGDSGGAWFIQSAGAWRLAGISYGVDGPFRRTQTGPSFFACLYDMRSLWIEQSGSWQQVPATTSANVPESCYATRVADRLSWIQAIVLQHGAEQTPPTVEGASTVLGSFAVITPAATDTTARSLRLPRTAETQFYRLRHCEAVAIDSISFTSSEVVLRYRLLTDRTDP